MNTLTKREELTDEQRKEALARLLNDGHWRDQRDTALYMLKRTPMSRWLASVELSVDGARVAYGEHSCLAAIEAVRWLAKRIDPDMLIESDRIIHGCKAECEFCCDTTTYNDGSDPFACAHFAGMLHEGPGFDMAYYVADTREWRRCFFCESYMLDADDECPHCQRSRKSEPECDPHD